MSKKTSRPRKVLDTGLPIYELKITLQHIEPPIWRRVQTNDCSLDELHDIIQASMGWADEHMHAFVVDGEEFGNPSQGSQAEYDSRSAQLAEIVEEGHTRFRYDYDFGDDWRHIIVIERTLPAEESVRYPRCLKGERACPPEDCGGPYGYPYLLDKIQDPEHEEHEEALEWVDDDFDPEEFDLDQVNEELRQLRRWLGKRKSKHSPQAAFAKGSLVRVKPGVVHDQYPDIPLGGWVGRVERIGWLTPIGYAVKRLGDGQFPVHDVVLRHVADHALVLGVMGVQFPVVEQDLPGRRRRVAVKGTALFSLPSRRFQAGRGRDAKTRIFRRPFNRTSDANRGRPGMSYSSHPARHPNRRSP